MDIRDQLRRLQGAVDAAEQQVGAMGHRRELGDRAAQVLSIPVVVPIGDFRVRSNSVVCGEDFRITRMGHTVEVFNGTGTVGTVVNAAGYVLYPHTGMNFSLMFDFRWNFVLDRTQQALGVHGNMSRRWLGSPGHWADLPMNFPKRVAYGERITFRVEPVLFQAVTPGVPANTVAATHTVNLALWGYRQGVQP